MPRCFACDHWGEMVLAINKPRFKVRPEFYLPMCEVHEERFLRRGLAEVCNHNKRATARLVEYGWIKRGGKYNRPALEFELV